MSPHFFAWNAHPLVKRFTPIITLVGLCWLVFVMNNLLWSGHLNRFGIVPRHLGGISGIFWAPLLHGSFKHLVANTVPLFILGGIICARGRAECTLVTLIGTLLSGAVTWVFARNASHIGASSLVFCFFAYLASMAYFRRTFGTLILSAVCILAYGGMLRGVVPTSTTVSWEGHIAGLVSGIALAWASSKLNPRKNEPAATIPECPPFRPNAAANHSPTGVAQE